MASCAGERCRGRRFTDREGSPSGVQGTIRDITHRKAVEAATWRRSQELAALNLIAARLNQSLQLSNTLPDALHALLEVVDAEFGAIHAIHDQRISPACRARPV